MKAIVLTQFGSPDMLRLEELSKPQPTDDQVLVKVHATTVNDWDWSFVRGKPWVLRLIFGIFKPRVRILGAEVAGRVEAVGKDAKKFKPGDEVYGDISESGFGGFAEYVSIPEDALALKPATMSFHEAAALPHASMLAVQGLIDEGQIREGEGLLINGAGGGVGTFGVQIAKLYGVDTTGVDSGAKLDLLRSVGFDHVIDYEREDFTKNGQRYDLILDTKTNRSPLKYVRSLKPGGRYVTVGGHLGRLFQILCLRPWISLFSKKHLRIVGLKPNKDLGYINELFEEGKLKCVIDGPFELSETPRAVQYFGEGKHRGKVVIAVGNGARKVTV